MIIPMKKVTLLCLEQDKSGTLTELRKLGLMQLVPASAPETVEVTSLEKTVADAQKALVLIRSAEMPKGRKALPVAETDGRSITEKALSLFAEIADLRKKRDQLERELEKLTPWGNFTRSTLETLENKGIQILFCVSKPAVFEERRRFGTFSDQIVVEVISRTSSQVCYVLISSTEDLTGMPDSVQLPEKSLNDVQQDLAETRRILENTSVTFASLKNAEKILTEYCREESAALEFATARDGMEKSGPLAWISGFVPETELDSLRAAALRCGWALLILDPDDSDLVPTYIRKPKFLNIMDPLFDFIGIQPGYHESDVNAFFLLFFPIFFGMIIGDAGYGVLFLVSALIAKYVQRHNPAVRQVLNLSILLSISSLIWGSLNGAWFGLPRDILPSFMKGINFLAEPAASPLAGELAHKLNLIRPGMSDNEIARVYDDLNGKFVQYLCFLLAAIHLGSGRIFKFFDEIPHTWRAVGHLGWACLIIANFFMAVDLIVFSNSFPAMVGYPLYAIGLLLIVITTSGAGFLNLPLSLVSSFVDVLSYIRLFAVGLSGTYIAVNFNKMGVMILDAMPDNLFVIGLVALILIAILGHVLNIALGFLSVMVHGIRLNTLEFSNHVNMQWTGIKFQPFSEYTPQQTTK